VPLSTVAREWLRIGLVGVGGPPAHIALLRELCVDRHPWLTERQFEDGIAATNLLPGPASTQLAIFCAWRVAGLPGALLGGLAFIVPGLVLIVALAVLFLAGSPPEWVLGAGAGAGAAVPAVAVAAGAALAPGSWRRALGDGGRWRWAAYVAAGAVAAATVGAWLVVVLLVCGTVELAWRTGLGRGSAALHAWPVAAVPALAALAATGGLGALAWTALKVGALSYGGGFVIVPLMQADAVDVYGWMTGAEFANAVALGQVTPGPVLQTVAVVGFAAAGIGGAALAAVCAFAPSFLLVAVGAERFERIAHGRRVRAFLDGAGPAAVGAILGSALPLALTLSQRWQLPILAAAAVALLALRRGVVVTLLTAGAVGAALALAGVDVPS